MTRPHNPGIQPTKKPPPPPGGFFCPRLGVAAAVARFGRAPGQAIVEALYPATLSIYRSRLFLYSLGRFRLVLTFGVGF